MAYELGRIVISLPKAADFSAKQFRFCKVDTSGNAAVAGRGDPAIGSIDDNSSVVGSATPIVVGGVAQVITGASVTAGSLVISDANGAAITLASGDNHVVGTALESGGSGAIIPVLIQPRSLA